MARTRRLSSFWKSWKEIPGAGRPVHARLAAASNFQLVSEDAAENQLFSDHILASLIESRCGIVLDPSAFNRASRRTWAKRATSSPSEIWRRFDDYLQQYWLMSKGRPIGTIAIANSTFHSRKMAVFGLYVLPAHRGAGHARRAIQTAYTAVAAEKIWGLRLETDWCWQPAVRFYCAIGLWVDLWKDGLVLVRGRGLPPWRLELDGDRAHFVVDRAAGPLVLFRARREGARLVWEAAAAPKRSASMDEMVMSAPSTFAVALALRGWPLHRSDGPWLAQRAVLLRMHRTQRASLPISSVSRPGRTSTAGVSTRRAFQGSATRRGTSSWSYGGRRWGERQITARGLRR